MAKKILSIEIGVWWSKVLVMDDSKKNSNIYDAFYFNTPDHSVEDGFIRDKEVFASALKTEFAKHHIVEKNVVFSINSSKLVTREVSIPFVKDNQIAGIVELQAKEFFPMSLANYTVSFKKLDTYVSEEGKFIKLLLVAVPDNILENYMAFAELMDLDIRSFEYMGNSAVQLICQNFMYNSVVVQLEENTTIVSMISDKQLVFQRVTPYGFVNALTAVLDNQVLGVDDDRTAFEFLENHDVVHVRAKVNEFVETSGIADTTLLQEKLDSAFDDVKDTYMYYTRIVSTALEYFQNQMKGEFRGRIHVIGDGARFAGIRKLFDDSFPLEAEKTDYSEGLHFHKDIVLRDLPRNYGVGLMAVAGVLIDPINIMPKAIKEKAGKSSAQKKYFAVMFVAIIASVVLAGVGLVKEMNANKHKEELITQRDGMQFIRQVYNEHDQVKNQASIYIQFDDSTKYMVEDITALIEEIEQKAPSDLVVTSISFAERKVTMNAESTSKLSVAQLIINLKEIDYLGNVLVPSLAVSASENGEESWKYTITADYVATQVVEREAE